MVLVSPRKDRTFPHATDLASSFELFKSHSECYGGSIVTLKIIMSHNMAPFSPLWDCTKALKYEWEDGLVGTEKSWRRIYA